MPIVIEERWSSRSEETGPDAKAELGYIVTGTNTPAVARAALIADEEAAPNIYEDLVLQSIESDRISNDACLCVANYGLLKPPQLGSSSRSFSTGGGSKHITQSVQTRHSISASGTAPNFRRSIGVKPDGVAGVDIQSSDLRFQETHSLSALAVNDSYVKTLANLTGCVNLGPFRGFSSGEVLFQGVGGSDRQSDESGVGIVDLTFSFAAKPNESNVVIAPGITIPTIFGWDYVWVYYQEIEDSESERTVKVPHSVYVEQVYPGGDFSKLGIG